METGSGHIIYTIGHSTHPIEVFIEMLQSFNVKMLADVRRFPGSRRQPQFNVEPLTASLTQASIDYRHLPDLGGRRKPLPDSHNTAWRNDAFRGYADYMETEEFRQAASQLEELGLQQTTAYMCAEAPWWRCHRALISDYLKSKGWTVMHIMSKGKATEHPYTEPARQKQGKLF